MTRRIEHRSTYEWSAAQVFVALIDIGYLRDRLTELGGTGTELVEHLPTEAGARFKVREEARAESLPAMARSVIGGDLMVDRNEAWRHEEDEHYTGEIAAEVVGAPCSITGSMWLRNLAEPSGTGSLSEFLIEGSVRITVPFLGSKLEDLVADEVQKLLTTEERFTAEWLSRNAHS